MPTQTKQAQEPALKPLDWIDLEDETGRTSALAINGRKPDAQGWLGVTGGLPHGLRFRPKDEAAKRKLMEWLCPGSSAAPEMREALRPLAGLEVARWSESGCEWWDKQAETMHKIPPELAAILIPAIKEARALLSRLGE